MNPLFLAYVLHLNYSHKIYLQVIINAIVPDFIEVNNNKEQKKLCSNVGYASEPEPEPFSFIRSSQYNKLHSVRSPFFVLIFVFMKWIWINYRT